MIPTRPGARPAVECRSVMPPPIPSLADQERLYPAIGEALLKSVPEDWTEILLRVKAIRAGKIELEIFGPAGVSNLRMPDDSLFPPAIELYELFAREAKAFESCDFSLTWDDARETWRFNAKYAYPLEA